MRRTYTQDYFEMMAYAKYSPNEAFIDFLNVDWSSFQNSLNSKILDIYVDFDIIISHNNIKTIHVTTINHGKAIMLHTNRSSYRTSQFNILTLNSALVQINDELYYLPFEQYYKLLQMSFYNIDELPKEQLRDLYYEQIKAVYHKRNDDLSFDIVDDTEAFKFWYQSTDNKRQLNFGRFYPSYCLFELANKLVSQLHFDDDDVKFELFNKFPDSQILTQDEFKALDYGFAYSQKQSYFSTIINRSDKTKRSKLHFRALETNTNVIENRIKFHHLNNIMGRVYYYDVNNTKSLYYFDIDKYGNVRKYLHPAIHDLVIDLNDFVRIINE